MSKAAIACLVMAAFSLIEAICGVPAAFLAAVIWYCAALAWDKEKQDGRNK